VVEFWFLAWMVATVQGGSQALSRSLFASMSPASKSGEFFGMFSIMEKFTALLGPALFAISALLYDSSRPAILGIVVFFFAGAFLLTKVDIQEGQRIARAEDEALLGKAVE
jgi:UMF1 family MFS transporter